MDNAPHPEEAQTSEAHIFSLKQALTRDRREELLNSLRDDEVLTERSNLLFVQPVESEDTNASDKYYELLKEAQRNQGVVVEVAFMNQLDRNNMPGMTVTVTKDGKQEILDSVADIRALQRVVRQIGNQIENQPYLFITNIGLLTEARAQESLRALIDGNSVSKTIALSDKQIETVGAFTSPLDNLFIAYTEDQIKEFDHEKANKVHTAFQSAVNALSQGNSHEITLSSRMGKTTFCRFLEKRYPQAVKYLTAQDAEFSSDDGITSLKKVIESNASQHKIIFLDEAQVISPDQRKILESTGAKIVYINVSDFMPKEVSATNPTET